MIELSNEEKAAVDSAIKRKINNREVLFSYGVYILPSLLFAVYAGWKRDFVASLVAYFALLIVAVLYLSYSFSSGRHLYSALEKYKNTIEAIKLNDKNNI